MAVAVSTPQSVSPSMSSSGGEGRIAVLFALRRCIMGTIDALCAAGLSEKDEAAIAKRCGDLVRIERDILAVPPHTIRDLCLQAEVVRHYASQGDFSQEDVCQLVANINMLAA